MDNFHINKYYYAYSNVANSYYENITKQMFFYNTTKYYLEKYLLLNLEGIFLYIFTNIIYEINT